MKVLFALSVCLSLVAAAASSQPAAPTCASVNAEPKTFENKVVTIRGHWMEYSSTPATRKATGRFLCVGAAGLDPKAGGFVVDVTGLPFELLKTISETKGGVNVTGRIRGTEKVSIYEDGSRRVAIMPFLADIKIEPPSK